MCNTAGIAWNKSPDRQHKRPIRSTQPVKSINIKYPQIYSATSYSTSNPSLNRIPIYGLPGLGPPPPPGPPGPGGGLTGGGVGRAGGGVGAGALVGGGAGREVWRVPGRGATAPSTGVRVPVGYPCSII